MASRQAPMLAIGVYLERLTLIPTRLGVGVDKIFKDD